MLSALREEQQGVACVLKPDADQYVLDGAALSLRIPRLLLEKIEQLPQQVRTRPPRQVEPSVGAVPRS